MSHYLWSIDEGHGGLNPGGGYTTPSSKGKQYTFTGDNPLTIYEGHINRMIGRFLKSRLIEAGIDFKTINDGVMDTPLRERVNKIDDIFHLERKKGRTSLLLSIHSNAMTKPEEIKGTGQSVASYNSIWTSRGATRSDKLVQFFERAYKEKMSEWRFATDSSDGDSDFEADFYILRKSDGPAVLVENLFFDNRDNANFLSSEDGQETIADTLTKAIIDIELIKPI